MRENHKLCQKRLITITTYLPFLTQDKFTASFLYGEETSKHHLVYWLQDDLEHVFATHQNYNVFATQQSLNENENNYDCPNFVTLPFKLDYECYFTDVSQAYVNKSKDNMNDKNYSHSPK